MYIHVIRVFIDPVATPNPKKMVCIYIYINVHVYILYGMGWFWLFWQIESLPLSVTTITTLPPLPCIIVSTLFYRLSFTTFYQNFRICPTATFQHLPSTCHITTSDVPFLLEFDISNQRQTTQKSKSIKRPSLRAETSHSRLSQPKEIAKPSQIIGKLTLSVRLFS